MYFRFLAPDEKAAYDLSELARMFLPDESFVMDVEADGLYDLVITGPDKNSRKRALYDFLREKTGKTLDWGLLTGVRPSKLYNELCDRRCTYSEEAEKRSFAETVLKDEYCVSGEKIGLLRRVRSSQQTVSLDGDPKAVGVYVGIPFCPTRCVYCSFTSNKITKPAASRYMQALLKEIDAVSDIMRRRGFFAESIYIGGGTPTSLDDEDFETLVTAVSKAFRGPKTAEFTVESGRPDTITQNKLRLIKAAGADRISINPQSMKQHTLDLIGRSHTPQQIREAFAAARAEGIGMINADLITGLPEELPEDFIRSLNEVIALGPENITVHTLAVKKASRLIEQDKDYAFRQAEIVRKMLEAGEKILADAGYAPYYMYRQKHMAGNFENVGYCKQGTASVYNIRIMEENQSIIALGAGGISKMFYPAENRLERVPNVSNYEVYIDRIDEMIERKEVGLI